MNALWSDTERAVLRKHYLSKGAAWVASQLGRSFSSVTKHASRLGLKSHPRWTARDDDNLRLAWGHHTVDQVAATLKRTPAAVYWRAAALGLGRGCPQGFEYLTTAAQRTGYATKQLRMILRWAGVCVRRTMARPDVRNSSRHLTHMVEPTDVDEAVARWHATEPLETAAERFGVCGKTLSRMLDAAAAAGDTRVLARPRKAKGRWRVPSALVAELFARRTAGESISEAAARIGVGPRTLSIWLERAGLRSKQEVRLRFCVEEIDRVVETHRASARCRAFCGRIASRKEAA